jgi:hypothetical protein
LAYNIVGNKAKKTMNLQIKISTILILGLLILDSCSVYRTETCIGKIGNVDYQNTYIKKNGYEGVIFSKDYIGLMNSSDKKFTPTQIDIDSAEIVLKKGVKKVNENRPNQVDNCPVIHRKLKKYKRQYFGFIDPNGDRIIFINCFWDQNGFHRFLDKVFYDETDDTKWKTEEKFVLDGCSYYWSIKVNLTKKTLFDFGVNGMANKTDKQSPVANRSFSPSR